MDQLAAIIRERVKNAPLAKPQLRIVRVEPPQADVFKLDEIAREAHIRRIRWLARAFRLQWLMDQSTFHVASIECLDDSDLSALLRDMERARECMHDDVSFEDAGLIRSRSVRR